MTLKAKEGLVKSVPRSKSIRGLLLKLPGRGQEANVFTFQGKPTRDIREGLGIGGETALMATMGQSDRGDAHPRYDLVEDSDRIQPLTAG